MSAAPLHLKSGLSCQVHYKGSVIQIPEPHEPFEVCNAVRAKVYGGAVLERDERYEAVMKRRKKAA